MAYTGVHIDVNCIHILTQQLILSIPWLEHFTDIAETFSGYNQNTILWCNKASTMIGLFSNISGVNMLIFMANYYIFL